MADLKEIHAMRCEVHQVAAEQYVVNCTTAYTSFQYLKEAYEEAKKAVIASGALAVDQHGKIKAGWYQGNSDYENQRVAATNNSGVVVGGGVAGVAGAIGAPVAAWTLVGTLGTASTGAAISGLSGAAATSATAARFGGGAVAAGGLGMAAAPFALSGIGIVAGVGIIGVAALIAGNRGRRNEKEMLDANKTMREAELRMKANASVLKNLEDRAKGISNKLIKATGVLEANKTDESVSTIDQALTEADQLFPDLQKELSYTRFYVGRPTPIKSVSRTTATQNSITMSWVDPDEGNSEITGYKILYYQGSWGSEQSLKTTPTPSFSHTGLEPGKTYYYKIIPVNKLGEAEASERFVAKTQPA